MIAALETLAKGSPSEVVLQTLGDKPPVEMAALVSAAGLPEAEVRARGSALIGTARRGAPARERRAAPRRCDRERWSFPCSAGEPWAAAPSLPWPTTTAASR